MKAVSVKQSFKTPQKIDKKLTKSTTINIDGKNYSLLSDHLISSLQSSLLFSITPNDLDTTVGTLHW